jgi:hypothetical protein
MAQISKGDTFVDGQQVTGARLNQLVDSSTLLVGAITDQPSITANTLEATDSTIVNDAGTLKEATIGDILNSNLPISTSSITGNTGVDIVVTPAVGQKVDIAGAFEAESINSVANTTIGGTLTVTGASTLTGNVIVDNGLTSNGIANFTGTLQVNGTVGYVLTEIVEETITPWITTGESLSAAFATKFTSSSYTKPTGEIWVVTINASYYYYVADTYMAIRLIRSSDSLLLTTEYSVEGGGSSYIHYGSFDGQYVFNSASTFTSTFKVDVRSSNGNWMGLGNTDTSLSFVNVPLDASKFRIYKYKTA